MKVIEDLLKEKKRLEEKYPGYKVGFGVEQDIECMAKKVAEEDIRRGGAGVSMIVCRCRSCTVFC